MQNVDISKQEQMMNYTQAFNQACEQLLDAARRTQARANRQALGQAVARWLAERGYTLEQYLTDDAVARECIMHLLGVHHG